MYTALRATSQTLATYLRTQFESDPGLRLLFDASAGGTMVVSLHSPEEMRSQPAEGLSVWLYQVVRDEERLNAPPARIAPGLYRRTPLPVRLHYLMTPVTGRADAGSPETEQEILGKVLQVLHDHPVLRGTDLQRELAGSAVELHVRLEPMDLEELTRVWDALDGSYQLSVSYEASVVYIESELGPDAVSPVEVVLPRFGVASPLGPSA